MKKRIPKKYLKVWIAFVNINAEEDYSFLDLVDSEGEPNENIIGVHSGTVPSVYMSS